jgi:hypothetical protein
MSEKVLKFAQRVNEVFPEIPMDALLTIMKEIDEAPTCKHVFIKGRNAKTQCKTIVKGGGEYCCKHKK